MGKARHHGCAGRKTRTPEYCIWDAMIQRCTNKKHRQYKSYGGRGIRVCQRWRNSFAAFLKDVGERPTKRLQLERVNNSRGYEPHNVKWATRIEQNRNKTDNRMLVYKGRNIPLCQLSEETGVNAKTLWHRLHIGLTPDQAVNRPVERCRRYYTYKGASHGLPKWAKVLGIPYGTLYSIVRERGLSVGEAISVHKGK